MWFTLLCAVALTAAVYWRNRSGKLVYDDLAVFAKENHIMAGNWLASLKNSMRGIPDAISALTIKWSGQCGKDAAEVVTTELHVTNWLLHAVNATLIFYLLKALGLSLWTSLLGTAFFLVQPLAVSAVAYITGRYSLIAATFSIASLLSTLTHHWILCAVFAVLAILCKPDTLLLPLQIGLILLFQGIRFWWLPPLAVLVGGFGFVMLRGTKMFEQPVIDTSSGWAAPLAHARYARRFFVESVLRFPKWFVGFGYSVNPDTKDRSWYSLVSACLVLLTGILLCMRFRSVTAITIGLIGFLVAPWVTYLFKPMPDIILEHRAYASLIGLSIFAALLLAWLPPFVAGSWLAVLAMVSHERAGFWSFDNLFEAAVKHDRTKQPMIMANHSSILISQGRLGEAKLVIEEALEYAPNAFHLWANLGTIAAMRRDHRAMLDAYTHGAMRCPYLPLAWTTLATVYMGSQRFDRAAACYYHIVKWCCLPEKETEFINLQLAQMKRLNQQQREQAIAQQMQAMVQLPQ